MRTNLLLALPVLFAGLFVACSEKENSALVPASKEDAWWIDRHAAHVAALESGPKVDLLMIGDSITHFWENTEGTAYEGFGHGEAVWEKFYGHRHAMNLGFASDLTQHVLWRLHDLPLEKISPKVAVLLIGTNNVTPPESTPHQTALGVQAIVQKLRATYPQLRNEIRGTKSRKRIAELNSYLPELVGDMPEVTLLDIGDEFLNQRGTISSGIMPDFLHPNAAGYEIWAKAMEPTLVKLLDD